MKQEEYSFQNVYLITTYRCNWDCDFCLFKYNKEKEASVVNICAKLTYALENSRKPVYLKITGGEPFLCPDLLQAVFAVCSFYKDKIYKIGIGTNGSIPLPSFFAKVKSRLEIFLSRHTYLDTLPAVDDLTLDLIGDNLKRMPGPDENPLALVNPNINFRINCNLISGQIDSLEGIKKHILWHNIKSSIDHFTFRELNHISLADNLFYPPQIYEYEKYYKEKLVLVSDIEKEIALDPEFELSRVTGNAYDTNRWYWYTNSAVGKVSVKFRIIDEQKLVEYNRVTEGVDEYVIHPDGTLTGCWDKELKPIRK